MPANDFSQTVQLLKSADAGDPDAFHLLLAKYQRRIHMLARVKLGAKLRGKMESMDIVQDAMVRALKSGPPADIKNEGAFVNWLYKLVEHQIFDSADKFKSAKRDIDHESPLDATNVRLNVDRQIAQGRQEKGRIEDMLILEGLLERLEADEKKLILDKDIYGYSFVEIAAQSGKTPDACRVRYNRIKFKLAKWMSDAG